MASELWWFHNHFRRSCDKNLMQKKATSNGAQHTLYIKGFVYTAQKCLQIVLKEMVRVKVSARRTDVCCLTSEPLESASAASKSSNCVVHPVCGIHCLPEKGLTCE